MGEIAKTYASTFLYNKGSYEKHLIDFLMTSKEIDKDSESFKDIRFDVKRRQIDNCLYKILDSKNVKLMISNIPLPKAFKVFAASDIKTDKKMRVFIDCTEIIKEIDGQYRCNNIDILIAYLVSSISNLVYYADPKRIVMNRNVIESGARAFSAMFTYIIDYIYKISNTPEIKAKCQYLASRYYIQSILNKEITDSTKALCKNIARIDDRQEKIFDIQVDDDTFKRFDIFLKQLEKLLKLNNLSVELIVEKWIYLYGTGTQFALEIFPAFASMMTNCYVGCYINNQKTIEKVAGRDMVDFTKGILMIGNEALR